ncbi:alpha/beta fold hydrolase [Hyalangium versicolor]|uniref:alpha/beta fold hydrolase n=1 Tax=Hyalangium versicolor TaxID=2861190 RepID=UPI001CCC3224|nr:alpha/beta hydrolase [Hyalangium versicolor]
MLNSMKRVVLAVSALLATHALAAGPQEAPAPKASVVFVHGAFADGSSWNKVIPLLQAKGLEVIAVQNPLSSLADDVAAAKRAIAAAKGPVVLVGHSWGGTVITEAGSDPKVKTLVYVAAAANDPGGSFNDLTKGYPVPAGFAEVRADASGFATLTPVGVAKHFAQDASPAEKNLISVTQGPIRGANFDEKVSAAAWQSKPSWYVVAAQDHMIQPDLQRALAAKIKAKTTVLDTGHVPMLTAPEKVAAVIEDAAKSASK